MKMHKCPVPLCREKVPPRLLMCRPHWRLVPTFVKDLVFESFQQVTKSRQLSLFGQTSPLQSEEAAKASHRKVARLAIKAVLESIERSKPPQATPQPRQAKR